MTQNSKQQYKNIIRRNERKLVLLPSRKTLQFISNVFFGFEKKKTKKQNQRKENSKKGTETFLTSFLKMPDENLSKEKVDFLITFFQTGR